MFRSLFICLIAFLASHQSFAQTDTVKTNSGLRYVVLQPGTGTQPPKGSKVSVHYTGKMLDGKVFDTSEGGRPLKFKAGMNQVIKGWDEMIMLMKPGQEVEVMIPAELAYGSHGIPGPDPDGYLVKPDSPLIFRIKLVEVKQ